VFIVDNHMSMRQQIARLMKNEFTVAGLVRDAEALIECWAVAEPDLIVLDVSLPGCSGVEAAARVRAAGCDAPIVFLSGHVSPEMARAAHAAGALGYVDKRDVERHLVAAVRAALAGRRFNSHDIRPRKRTVRMERHSHER
jgi:DNA-binding NarL/FixJ family response regulator